MKNKLNLISIVCLMIFLLISIKGVSQFTILGPEFYPCNDAANCDSNNSNKNACVNQDAPNRAAILRDITRPFPINTEFILELSDVSGVFSNTPLILTRFTTNVAIPQDRDIDFDTPFPIPTNLSSDNYSMRVRAIIPNEEDVFSRESTGMSIAYFDSSNPLTVNGVSAIGLCFGEAVDLIATPSDFPEYEWAIDQDLSNNFVVISGETGSTLSNASESGRYRVRIPLPTLCDGLVDGNEGFITLYDFDSTSIQINEAPRIEYCPNDSKLLTASISDNDFTYEWFKDDVLQPQYSGAVINLSESNFSGFYTVNIIGSETCSITTSSVEVVNLGSDILTQPPPKIMLLPTEPTLVLAITTNAPPSGSTIEWLRNGISFQSSLPIDSPGALSIDVTNTGTYTARLFANDVCMDTLTSTTEVFEPVDFRAVITNFLSCEENAGTIGLENLFGITATGEEVAITVNQYPLFDFEWFLDGQSTGITENVLPITAENVGDTYSLEATLRGSSLPKALSNELIAELFDGDIQITADPSLLIAPNGEIILSVPQSTTFTYEWYRVVDDEEQLIEGQTTNEITVSEAGDYFVRIASASCSLDTPVAEVREQAGLSGFIPNVLTPNSDGINDTWNLPEELTDSPEVEVIIYDSRGQVTLQTTNYRNGDWPNDTSALNKETVYYYMITKNNSVIRKGSITVMK